MYMYSLRGSEPTALEAVDCEWRYALLVVQVRNDNDDDDEDDDYIGNQQFSKCIKYTWKTVRRVVNKS